MARETYLTQLNSGIDAAISLGQSLLKTSRRLHKVCDTADGKDPSAQPGDAYYQDSLMYFDFNDAATELSSMPKTMVEFKKQLVEILAANDHMLLYGEYREDISTCIKDIFKSGTLYDLETIEAPTLQTVADAVAALEQLK